jgi:hypothetical protein
MSDYHNVHWVEFYPKSHFSPPVFVTVNCITFDVLSRLTGPDADLCFTTNHCFICFQAMHRSEICLNIVWECYSVSDLMIPIVRDFMDRLLGTDGGFVLQGGMCIVLGWTQLRRGRPSGRRWNRGGSPLL